MHKVPHTPTDNVLGGSIQAIECEWPRKGASQYFRFGGDGYKSGIRHYLESSSQYPYAVVQPGNEDDLAALLKFISGANTCNRRIPFAVKGGGHSTNPGFSSTTGLQISMTRLNDITYDPLSKTLSVGAGCLWDEVYKELHRLDVGRNVVGGSAIDGVGVAGYLLGGGYSLKTNQYGLGIDNIREVDVVLPTGEIVRKVGPENKPDLFEAIKGGGNNFGIVTKFVLDTHEQKGVWGCVVSFGQRDVLCVKGALLDFIANCDKYPKASIVAAFRHFNTVEGREFRLTLQLFYDGPKPPPGVFDPFLCESHKSANLEVKPETRDYADLDEQLSRLNVDHQYPEIACLTKNPRGRWANVMVSTYNLNLIDELELQAKRLCGMMDKHRGQKVVSEVWPFTKGMFDNAKPSAFPHFPGQPNGPALICVQWEGKENDAFWIEQLKQSAEAIRKVAHSDGLTEEDAAVYLNSALAENTTVEQIYRENLPRLEQLRTKYDPKNVMSLAGGFRIPSAKAECKLSNGMADLILNGGNT